MKRIRRSRISVKRGANFRRERDSVNVRLYLYTVETVHITGHNACGNQRDFVLRFSPTSYDPLPRGALRNGNLNGNFTVQLRDWDVSQMLECEMRV